MDVNESILVMIFLSVIVVALAISYFLREKFEHRKFINVQRLIEKDKQIIEDLRLRLNAMFQISRGFVQAEDEGTIINLVLTQAMNVTGATGASFVPLDERGQPAGVIRQGEFPNLLPDAWLEYLASPTIRQQCNDCKNHGSIMTICPLLKGPFPQAMGLFCLPLRRCDQELGILNLYLPNEGRMGTETQDFLRSLIDETALALEWVRLRKRELTTIGELEGIKQRNDLSGMLLDLLLSLQTTLSADYVYLAIKSDGIDLFSKERRPYRLLSVGRELPEETRKLLGKVIEQVFTTSKEFMSDDISVDQQAGKPNDMIITAPLWATEQQPMGVIVAGKCGEQHFHEYQQMILTLAASQMALVVENTQRISGLQYKATIEERVRLAREIHDGLAQTLGFLKLQTAQMQSSLDRGDLERLRHMLKVSYSALAEAYQDVREAIDGLRVIGVGTDGDTQIRLDKAIQQIVQEYQENDMLPNVEINLSSLEDKINLSPEVTVQIIRILQEALSNIRKHSVANRVWINTREDGQDMILEIRDNGNGFAAEDIPEMSRHGLKGMRERAELIGGDFQVISRPGAGTTVSLRYPLLERKNMEV